MAKNHELHPAYAPLAKLVVGGYVDLTKTLDINYQTTNLDGNIIMANHQKMLDIPAIFLTCKELSAKQPFFIMRDNILPQPLQYIMERSSGITISPNPKENRAAMKFAKQKKQEGHPIVVFPQGTRYDGYFGPISKTAVRIWSRYDSIIPMGVQYQKGSITINIENPRKIDIKESPEEFFSLQYELATLANLDNPKTGDGCLDNMVNQIIKTSYTLANNPNEIEKQEPTYQQLIDQFLNHTNKDKIKHLH